MPCTGNENMKIVFCSYLRQKWIDLRQTKTEMIIGPFYTYRRINFTMKNASFLRQSVFCNYLWVPYVAAAT